MPADHPAICFGNCLVNLLVIYYDLLKCYNELKCCSWIRDEGEIKVSAVQGECYAGIRINSAKGSG